jgi:Fe-S oxidoreductase
MMQGKKADRGKWADDLHIKNITEEACEVYFHAGCRYSYDESLWPQIRAAASLMKKAGVDFGIGGKDENCCGGRAYELGYLGEFTKYAENNLDMLKTAGIKTVVTSCAEGYYTFKVLYPKLVEDAGLEVYHITEYLDLLIREERLKPSRKVPMKVTYHDPCHLGRLGEPWVAWEGEEKTVFNQMYIYDPPKPWRKGTHGVYEPPRDVIRSIPGIDLVEMERIKEYAFCCGAGGGVIDAYPDFAAWTALERIEEARATGAEAMVTACPWCRSNFVDALDQSGEKFKILDIVELVDQAI